MEEGIKTMYWALLIVSIICIIIYLVVPTNDFNYWDKAKKKKKK